MKIKIISLIVLSLAVASCGENPKEGNVTSQAEEVPGGGNILAIRSLATTVESSKFDYSALCAVDGNLATGWSVCLETAQEEGFYDGRVLQGLEITLAQPHIDQILLWNGFWKCALLLDQNSSAAAVELYDSSDGTLLFESPVKESPFIGKVDRDLKACEDGSYRVLMNFGSERYPGVKQGTKFTDFCIAELQITSDGAPVVQYPAADRAAMGLKGPVKSCDGVVFDICGFTHYTSTSMLTYHTDETVLKSVRRDESGAQCKITETYDKYCRLVNRVFDYSDGNIQTEEYEYDSDGNLVSQEESGNYQVIEEDSFGNWTRRKNLKSGKEENRTIEYY